MKLVHKLTFALLSLFALGTACASPIAFTYTDSFSPGPNVYLGTGNPSNESVFTLSFLDKDPPFDAGFDVISSAKLIINLQDNGQNQGGDETFHFDFGNETFSGSNQANQPAAYEFDLTTALAGLNADGFLEIGVFADSGSFRFISASLEVFGTRGEGVPPVEEVPEPLSIALMGLGLAGLTAARRRK